jgi:hypothetical protein
MTHDTLEKRLRLAGVLIALGLIVQVATLWKVHPLAFVAFLTFACPLIGAGVLLFLFTILKSADAQHRQSSGSSR